MKNKKVLLYLINLILIFSLYKSASAVATADIKSGSSGAKTAFSAETNPESVSTGTELMEWLNLHKSTGGTVKLSGNITLDEYYCFVPMGINGPSIFIDTGNYTITVTGETEFFSDCRLTFYGQTTEKGIFRVAEGGLLSLTGVIIEGDPYALWQEEGTGLIVDNCRITGNVHYADTPFVLYRNSGCAVVEPGQTADDVLPSEIKCKVNYQGQVNRNAMVPVVWNPEGTEQYQKNRLRFQMQGFFPGAAAQIPPLCTVAYNDYPLTFTEADASTNGNIYMFQGSYTKPEEKLPITVLSEYSFDGENWHTYNTSIISHSYEPFFISLTSDEWNTAVHPWLYIRLQWQDGETPRFSNVLRYVADNLDHADDQGGNRGGGTSIANPPDEPSKDSDTIPSENLEPIKKDNTDVHNQDMPRQDTLPDIKPSADIQNNQDNKKPDNTINKKQTVLNSPAEKIIDKETNEIILSENEKSNDTFNNFLKIQRPALSPDNHAGKKNIILLGLFALPVIAGTGAFCFHAGIFRKLFHTIKKFFH